MKCQGALSAKGEVKYTVRSRSGKLKRVTKRITVGYQPINQSSPNSKQYNFLLGPRSKELLQTAGKMRVTVSAYDTSTPARITNTTEIELKLKR